MAVLWAATILIGVCHGETRAQTIADNVMTVLRAEGLENSIDIVEVCDDHLIAAPRRRPEGSYDTALFDSIMRSRKAGRKEWIHDNVVWSWLWGHGTRSYRERTRPSLHAVFFFSRGGVIEKIKLDIDRFPPGATKVTGARHALQELIPNKVFGKKTDQNYIAGALQRKYRLVSAPNVNPSGQ